MLNQDSRDTIYIMAYAKVTYTVSQDFLPLYNATVTSKSIFFQKHKQRHNNAIVLFHLSAEWKWKFMVSKAYAGRKLLIKTYIHKLDFTYLTLVRTGGGQGFKGWQSPVLLKEQVPGWHHVQVNFVESKLLHWLQSVTRCLQSYTVTKAQ